MPLSNKMKTNVIVVNTGPTAPKFSGFTQPHIGPMIKPIVNNHKTSGIFVRAKSAANQCDIKIVQPTKTMVSAVGMKPGWTIDDFSSAKKIKIGEYEH
jgi:hypothetical protein